MCDITHSYVWHDSFVCVTWLIHMCDMTHSYVWHDSFMCVTWLIHMCAMTHSCVWHDSFICVTRLIHLCAIPHADHVNLYLYAHICIHIHTPMCMSVCVCSVIMHTSYHSHEQHEKFSEHVRKRGLTGEISQKSAIYYHKYTNDSRANFSEMLEKK